MKFKNTVLSWQHLTSQRDPAFSVGHLLILHVKSMFGKYRPARGCCMHVFPVVYGFEFNLENSIHE